MNRFALLAGIFSGTAAWMIARQKNNQSIFPFLRPRPIPVQVAVAKLQEAWADHHTRV